MNYIIYKADGSVLVQNMEFYIQQGNSGDKIFVGFEGALATDTATAFFTLPNKQTNTIGGVNTTKTIKVEGVDTTFRGFEFTLTTSQTTYNGYLRMAVMVYRDNNLLVSYPLALIINETGVRPDADTGVTIEELNGYLAQIQSLSKDNVRTYNLTDSTTFSDIIADIGLNQFFAVSWDNEISLCIIYTDGSTYSMLINNPYGVYTIDSVAESQVVKSATLESIFMTDNKVSLNSPSGTLTSSQINQISQDDCYIVFADRKFTLAYRDTLNNVVYFRCLRHINNYHGSEDYIEFDIETITVNTSTGAYGYSYGGTNFYYYNKTQAENKFEEKAHKVTSVSNTSTDTQYPSAKCLYDNVQNAIEVAEGKCQTFILAYSDTLADLKTQISQHSILNVYDADGNDITQAIVDGDYDSYNFGNAEFNSQNANLSFDWTKYLIFRSYQASNLVNFCIVSQYTNLAKIGDIFLVVETDVPDRWYGGGYTFYKLETTKVNISNMVTTDTDQDIDGTKTIINELDFKYSSAASYVWKIVAVSDYELDIKRGSTTFFSYVTTQGIGVDATFYPASTGKDLGKNDHVWSVVYANTLDTASSTALQLKSNSFVGLVVNGSYNFAVNGTNAISYVDLVPNGNGTTKLGDSSKQWKEGWINTFKGVTTMTQAQYDAITPDANTLYFIEEE